MECREIFISNIPATDTAEKLTTIFESKRVTGIANCSVEALTFDADDSSCAIVKFTTAEGSLHAVVIASVFSYCFYCYDCCQSTCVSWQLQLRTGEFCWTKSLISTYACCCQQVLSGWVDDARVLLSASVYIHLCINYCLSVVCLFATCFAR